MYIQHSFSIQSEGIPSCRF